MNQGAAQAQRRLHELYLEEYNKARQRAIDRRMSPYPYLRVIFPEWAEKRKQFDWLYKVEDQTMKAIAAIMRADVARLVPYDWQVEKGNRAINDWVEQARDDNKADVNWQHNKSTHDFGCKGIACGQLKEIGRIGGWKNQ